MAKMQNCQCLSNAEFPEFLKNGLTFYHRPLLIGVMVKIKQWLHFLGHPVDASLYVYTQSKTLNLQEGKGCDVSLAHIICSVGLRKTPLVDMKTYPVSVRVLHHV